MDLLETEHAAHIAVGACYVIRYGPAAYERMKNGILRYKQTVGTPNTESSGYHETLTRFWLQVIVKTIADGKNEWQSARDAVHLLAAHQDLFCRFYSFDVVRSAEARKNWIEPDLEAATLPLAELLAVNQQNHSRQ